MAYIELISLDQCNKGTGTFVEHEGRELAVFLLADPDRVVVTDNACPHASGNLSGGEIEGNVVSCPWHQWKFDLDRGVCTHSDKARIDRFSTEIRDGVVWVDLKRKLH